MKSDLKDSRTMKIWIQSCKDNSSCQPCHIQSICYPKVTMTWPFFQIKNQKVIMNRKTESHINH